MIFLGKSGKNEPRVDFGASEVTSAICARNPGMFSSPGIFPNSGMLFQSRAGFPVQGCFPSPGMFSEYRNVFLIQEFFPYPGMSFQAGAVPQQGRSRWKTIPGFPR